MSNLGINKPTLEPPHWRRKVRDFLYYLADRLQELASTVPALTPSTGSTDFVDKTAIRADGTGGDLQDSGLTIETDRADAKLTLSVLYDPAEMEFIGNYPRLTIKPDNSAVFGGSLGGDQTSTLRLSGSHQDLSIRARDIDFSASTVLEIVVGTTAIISMGLGGFDVTGNIVVSGTVDGRDVAADGTKLDGIESAATADQTGAEIKTAYEGEADTNAFTDAEQTKLSGVETAADVTDATNVEAAGALMEADGTTYVASALSTTSNAITLPTGGDGHTLYKITLNDTTDIQTINGGNIGDILIFEVTGSTIIKHNTGSTPKIRLDGLADVTLSHAMDRLMLEKYNANNWVSLGAAANNF